MVFGSFLRKLKNVVAPVIGTAVAGPLGGIVAGGLAGAFDEGDKLKNILKGAGTAAAGIGVSKGLSALKGAVTAGDTASKALSLAPGEGVTGPASDMLAKKVGTDAASELAKKQITTPAVKALGTPAVTGSTSVGANAARIAEASASAAGTAAPASGLRITPPSGGLTSRTVSSPISSGSLMPTPNTPPRIEAGGRMDRLRELISGLGGFAEENPEVAMGIAQGLGSAFSTSPQEQEIEYMKELAAARARMLSPLYAQYSREFMG